MTLLIKGLHIEELFIDTDPEETSPELSWNFSGTSSGRASSGRAETRTEKNRIETSTEEDRSEEEHQADR